MSDTLAELEHALARHAPHLLAELPPPVTDHDLAALADSVAPYELPDDLITLLRWHDGTGEGDWLWPHFATVGLSRASLIARDYPDYRDMTDEAAETPSWPRSWLPIGAAAYGLVVLDLDPTIGGVLLDPGDGIEIVSPNLQASLDVTISLLNAGIQLVDPAMEDVDGDSIGWMTAMRGHARSCSYDWSGWPYDLRLSHRPDTWPEPWRASLGVSKREAWEPAQRMSIGELASVVSDDPIRIEGYNTRMAVATEAYQWGGRISVYAIDDGTGTTNVLVGPDEHLYGDGVRYELEVINGPSAAARIERLTRDRPWVSAPPASIDALFVRGRHAVQGRGLSSDADPRRRRGASRYDA
jgi:hypothetical protein